MFDPVIIIFSFNTSKSSQPTLFAHQTDSHINMTAAKNQQC